jgi:hypothetical protein
MQNDKAKFKMNPEKIFGFWYIVLIFDI